MTANTKIAFVSLLKRIPCDVIFDIGSCDGQQSLLFRRCHPAASIVAFEANPHNFARMSGNGLLAKNNIRIYPHAVCNRNGTATFFVTDVDHDDPDQNRGTSSLLEHPGIDERCPVSVETVRLDSFVQTNFADSQLMALWIDVEGAEYAVLETCDALRSRIALVHVETAESPIQAGQRPLSELTALMTRFGFAPVASSITPKRNLGDVVFINTKLLNANGWWVRTAQLEGRLGHVFAISRIATFTKRRAPALHQVLRVLFSRLV
ncbi:MAG: FkbM family methyltransferase [Lentisphaerales bacterium]|nr:MAG: FkbM family methyltransferase [Lentisphaerales bacterium]